MFTTLRLLPLLTGGTLLLAGGVVHGLWTDRWAPSAAMRKSAADRLTAIPMVVGDWTGQDATLDERQLQVANVAGHFPALHSPQHRGRSQRAPSVRPAGAVGGSWPEICYAGSGFEMDGDRDQWAATAGKFWTARFRKQGPDLETLRIFWVLGTERRMDADNDPRCATARPRRSTSYMWLRGSGPARSAERPGAGDRLPSGVSPGIAEMPGFDRQRSSVGTHLGERPQPVLVRRASYRSFDCFAQLFAERMQFT